MVEARDITFGYSRPVLNGVSFEVSEGELFALLGPNGSGKSTLIKIVVGLLKPQSGSVRVDGRNPALISRREAARAVGYVAQESSVRFPLTAMEMVLQGRFAYGQLIGFESERDLVEAKWAMSVTETTEFAATPITQLSGGERQRVMLARALAVKPKLLVLDEPVANLDIAHQVKMLDLVRELTQKTRMSAIVVTHELNLAAEFATSVLLLKSGERIAAGKPDEVMTEAKLRKVFETGLIVDKNPVSGAPRMTLVPTKSQ